MTIEMAAALLLAVGAGVGFVTVFWEELKEPWRSIWGWVIKRKGGGR